MEIQLGEVRRGDVGGGEAFSKDFGHAYVNHVSFLLSYRKIRSPSVKSLTTVKTF